MKRIKTSIHDQRITHTDRIRKIRKASIATCLSATVIAGSLWAAPLDASALPKVPTGAELLQRVSDAEKKARGSLMPVPQVGETEIARLSDSKWGAQGTDITARLQKAVNDPKIRIIDIPAGTFTVGTVTLSKVENKFIRGQGTKTVLKSSKNVGPANFVIPSGGGVKRVQFRNFVLDQGWKKGDPETNGFQASNADMVQFYKMAIKNVAKAGILAQKHGDAAVGTSNLLVLDSLIERTGLNDGTVGSGILIQDDSPHAMVVGNRLTNIKGGIGISAATIDKKRAPTKMIIIDNFISMVRSNTAFEGIGLSEKAHGAIVARNVTDPSFDNGLSLTSGDNLAIQNYTSRGWNHGVAVQGSRNIVVANEVGPIGLENRVEGKQKHDYAALALENGSSENIISSNRVSGGEMAYAVKFNGSLGGSNYIGRNSFTGWKKSEYSRTPHSTDVIDHRVPDLGIPFLTAEQRAQVARNAGPSKS